MSSSPRTDAPAFVHRPYCRLPTPYCLRRSPLHLNIYQSFRQMVKTVLEWASQILPSGMLTNQLEFFAAGYLACVALMFVIGILIAVWVYRDAQSRGMSGVLWLIVVILLSWIGLIIYLVVRSPKVAPPMMPYGAMAPPPAYGAPPPPPPYGAPAPGYAPAPPPQAPPMSTNCRYCGAPLPPGAVVCPRCGGRL